MKRISKLIAAGALSLALGVTTIPALGQDQGAQPRDQEQQAPPPQYPGQDQGAPQQQAPPPQYPAQAPTQNAPNQPAPNAQQDYVPVPPSLTLPAGTVISVHSSDWLSSDHNKTGDIFSATLARPLIVDGWVVARRGQTITGKVVNAEKAGRVKGVSKLGLELGELTMVDGQILPVKTQLLQGTGGTSRGRDAAAIAGTTGFGAAVGAAADWGTGAAIGAGAGAAAGIIGVLVTRGRPTVVGPEELLTFRLHDAVTFSTVRGEMAYAPATEQDYGRGPQQHERRYVRRYPPYPYGPPPPPPYYYPYGPYYYGPYWGRW